jgi:NADH-quinone oxidoreductase subunit N
MENILHITPEIFIFCSALILLILGLFIKNIKLINNLAILSLLIAVALVINQPFQSIYLNSYVIDEFSSLFKIMIFIGSIVTLVMFVSSREDLHINLYEFPILILFSTLGMMVMVSANDLLAMFIGLELQSLSLYVLAALNRNSLLSSEAGIKYFILGALSSGLLLFGISYIYGFSGNTNFNLIAVNYNSESLGLLIGIVFVLAGLAFKVSAVPFHMWTPDVYQGAPTPITAFFALAPKIAAMGLLVRFLFNSFGELYLDWQQIIFFISIASMMLAAFAAIAQTNIKRLMAYSSIGHIGYALIGVACVSSEGLRSLLIYLMIYLVMNISVFTVILSLKRNDAYFENISDLSGMYKNHPFTTILVALMMFSLAGIPPLAGFFGKFYIFVAALESNMVFLAVIGIIASVISAFYYLRIVKIMYFDEPKEEFDGVNIRSLQVLFYPSSFLVILFFIYPAPIIQLSEYAIKSFY